MIGVVIVAHVPLASACLQAVEHILGTQNGVFVYDVPASEDPKVTQQRIQTGIMQVDQGQGVVVLSDICGATPANTSQAAVVQLKTQVIAHLTGVNVAMLLRVFSSRQLAPADLIGRALDGAQQGVLRLDTLPLCD